MTIGAEQDRTPTEFVSRIRAAGDAGEFTKLSTWEDEVECDLTATTTRVFSGSATGAIVHGNTLEWFSNNIYQNVTATLVSTSSTQILLKDITGANYDLVIQSGDQWRLASSTDNMWEVSGATGNELGDTVIAVAECYNDWPTGLDDYVKIDGWTTDADNYVKVYAPKGERHNGKAKDGAGNYTGFAIKQNTNWEETIDVSEDYTRLDGLIADGNKAGVSGNNSVFSLGTNVYTTHCIAINGEGAGSGFYLTGSNNRISNCVAYDNDSYGFLTRYGDYIYNCTAIDNGSSGFYRNLNSGSPILKNCLAKGNSIDFSVYTDKSLSCDNCASSDGTADDWGGSGNRINQTFTFIDEANDDFHLASGDKGAKDYGTDLSSDADYPISNDIDYVNRGGTWDIGADEVTESVWYNTAYQCRRTITLEADQIATTTSAFPILATTTLAELKTTTFGGCVENDNGHDIVFVDSDGSTLLDFEREKYASTTGEIAYWIKTDISSTTDKTIYMYYGNSGASDLATTTGVWDDNYVGIWHLPDDETASTTDSTKYDNDGTAYADASSTPSGWVDGAFEFDGTGDYVKINNANITGASPTTETFTFWVKRTGSPGTNKGIFQGAAALNSSGPARYFQMYSNYTMRVLPCNTNYSSYTTTALGLNEWNHIVWARNGTSNKIYVNGIEEVDSTITATCATSYIYLANGYDGYFPGLIDEVRVSNVARTAQWIETGYNNQGSVGSFMTIGAEESSALSKVNSPLTNKLTDG
ncbi:DUF2341 domain-containing protein, partial [Candidatus Parcubacteria bacterium]|nr:DUF2341 domain-containing protein [Candidatus Parcubacteria bacterium]